MSAVGLEGIDHTVQLTHQWINELDERLGWRNKGRTYQLLKCVLQALRDWLPPSEVADLAAQLPTLVRGLYYEHWRPAAAPVKHRSKADFLERVDREFVGDMMFPLDQAVTVVFEFLSKKVKGGEVKDVRQALPSDLRALWPESAKAA